MLGAIIGDIVGSRFEFNNAKGTDFDLFTDECSFTDDTICTIAVADALNRGWDFKDMILTWCKKYPNPMGSYGGSFARWLRSTDHAPYNSFGNGSAMRISPVAWFYDDLEVVIQEAEQTALSTHNHPEGIKGAVSVARSIFMGRKFGKSALLQSASQDYQFQWPFIGKNPFDETCQGTLPICYGIIWNTHSFEEAIRLAIGVGGDSDTIGAIVGSLAEAIYGIPDDIAERAIQYLPLEMIKVIHDFYDLSHAKPSERIAAKIDSYLEG